jgi:hypothetical protein
METNDFDELKKCLDDPVYFVERYGTINGERLDPLTDSQKEMIHDCSIKYMSRKQIIDKYGDSFTKEQLKILEDGK